MPYILDGNVLPLDIPFVYNEIKYPANWLRLSTQEDRDALGITWRDEQPRPDDRFYWVKENEDGSYTATPKDLDGLKKTWSSQFNQTAYSMLLPSDWMVVRKQENATEIPADWTTYREAVRTTCQLAITDLTAATDIDAFIASVLSVQWPLDPDAQAAKAAAEAAAAAAAAPAKKR